MIPFNSLGLCESQNLAEARVDAVTSDLLDRYDWPGNIRELENTVERAMVVAQEPELREQDFLLKLSAPEHSARTLEDMEGAHILSVLEDCKGNQTQAPEILDIDRVTLHNKLKKFRLEENYG